MKQLWMVFGLLVLLVLPVSAQQIHSYHVPDDGEIHEFSGSFGSSDDIAQLTLLSLDIGQTVYVFVQAGGDMDPLIAVFNAQDFNTPVAVDDNGGGGKNPLLQFAMPARGDYIVAIFALEGAGDFRIVAGIDTPAVLDEAISDTTFGNTILNSAAGFSCDTVTLGERPELGGKEEIMDHPDFLLHYTLEGENATTPDFATVLYVAVDNALKKHVEYGWTLPIPDCGEGGDNRFDVYLINLGEGFYGYAGNDNAVGDNPMTTARELNAYYGHLVLDNDMIEEPDPFLVLQVAAAHELHHVVQFGYDGRGTSQFGYEGQGYYGGFYEGGAIWMATQVYPGDPLLPEVTRSFFEFPDSCLWSQPYRDGFSRVYGEWLMIDSIARDLGPQSYQKIWENLIVNQGMTGFYRAMANAGTTPLIAMKRLAIRNLLRDYPNVSDAWGTVAVEATVAGQGSYKPRINGVQQLGVDYLHITAEPGTYAFDMSGGDFDLTLVGIDMNTKTATTFDMRNSGVVDITPFTDVYVLVMNTGEPVFPEDCVYTPWTLRVSNGRGFPQTAASRETWSAANFVVAE